MIVRIASRAVLAGLVVVALGLAMRVIPWRGLVSSTDQQPPGSEIRELVRALSAEPARPVEGRLAGGFPYVPTTIDGPNPAGRVISPDVKIAVARIEKLLGDDERAASRAVLAIAYLALGNLERAVESLEQAVQQEATNPALQNDLAVCYLARASADGVAEYWVRGLAAANRAIALDNTRPEPYFNRAMAFRGLQLRLEEENAWVSFLSADATGGWAAEARSRLDSMRRRHGAAGTATEPDHQRLRELIEDRLLAEWGAAVERAEQAEAERLLAEAGADADRLAAAGGDTMAANEISRIRSLHAAGASQMVRRLAAGHRLYGEARQRFVRDDLSAANDLMTAAAAHFRAAGSPYWQFSPVTRAIVQWSAGQSRAALAALQEVSPADVPSRHLYLRGRLAWIASLVHGGAGRYDLARSLLIDAVELFRSAGERDNLMATRTNLAEAEWFLGEEGRAWATLVTALADADQRTRRTAHLDLAATMAIGAGLPEAAIEFHHSRTQHPATATAASKADAYLRRARTFARSGDDERASDDLARAFREGNGIEDPLLRQRIALEIQITRAELLSRLDCARAIPEIDVALVGLTGSSGTIRRGSMLTTRGRCRESLGDLAGARTDLLAAVEVFEARRATLADAADRTQAFELERAAFKQLIALEAIGAGDEKAAYRVAERARAGVLAETWGWRGEPPHHTRLPRDVAVIYYESLPDRVLTWVLTRERRAALTTPIGADALGQSIGRIQRAIRLGADLPALRLQSAALFDALIAPALDSADAAGGQSGAAVKSTIVFVPDGPLFALPFGALPDSRGRPLLEGRRVAIAPSVTTFVAASARLSAFQPSDVLAIGDGHDSAATGLPRLPRADLEASDVGRMYPDSIVLTGADATKRRVLESRPTVLHFSGHSILNLRYPLRSRMLLAPEAAVGDSGWLFATEITPERFRYTDVVVLATCEAAAGKPVEGEGAISIANAFFAAGVPAVVASLWPVDDDLQTLTRALHTTLRSARDAAEALRAGQLAILQERGPGTPVRVWGGFIVLGGVR